MDIFTALADPVRRAIITTLSDGDATAGQIGARFAISQPAVSRHLRVLRQVGLATVRVDAQHRIYALDAGGLAEAEAWLAAQRAAWAHRFDRLGEHLDRMERPQ